MGSPDRMATLIERIEAVNRRIEAQMDNPALSIETVAHLLVMHEEWRKTLAACLASMERAQATLQRSRKLGGADETGWPPY